MARIESRSWMAGEAIEPTRATPPTAAISKPILSGERPWRRAMTTNARTNPFQAKLLAANRKAHARKNRCRQSQAKPSPISARKLACRAGRSSWNGVRIATNVASENPYEIASARNGRTRPSPNNTPPSGGPPRTTLASRPWSTAAALGNCSAVDIPDVAAEHVGRLRLRLELADGQVIEQPAIALEW
jgi:hypothetical protein